MKGDSMRTGNQRRDSFLFLFVTLCMSIHGWTQPPHVQFHHLTPDQGLSSSTVTCFLQDHKGFMWIGTYYGLNRYDGYQFIVYTHQSNDTTSLPHNLIWTIFEDKKQNLWIGTGSGLCRYDRKRDRFVDYMGNPSSPLGQFRDRSVLSIAEDSLGNLWIGTTKGVILFNPQTNQIDSFLHDAQNPNGLSYSNAEAVFVDHHQRVWIGTGKGLNLFNSESKTFDHSMVDENGNSLSDGYFTEIAEDKQGNLWFGTYGHGLYFLPSNAEKLVLKNHRHQAQNPGTLSGDYILSLYVDKEGKLWVGTENAGLNLWDPQLQQFWHYRSNEYDPYSLNNESIYAIYQDESENLWIGTFAGGINRSKVYSEAILHYTKLPGVPTSLSHPSVTCFLEDHGGKIWIGTDGGGLNLFDPNTGQFTHFNSQNSKLKSNAIVCLAEDGGHNIWIGTWGGGLHRMNPQTHTFQAITTSNSKIPDDRIISLWIDSSRALWIGSFRSGLIHYIPQKNQFFQYTPQNSKLPNEMVTAVAGMPDGQVLVGTPSGLNIFNPGTKQFVNYFHHPEDPHSLSDNSILCFAIENDTAIWIGTQNGLNRFHPQKRTFTRFSTKEGLPNEVVKGLVLDASGKLWVSTHKGISCFDIKRNTWKIFLKSDGLQGNEFNERSVYRLKNGGLLFGGPNGFNLVYPEKIKENKYVPAVVLTDFRIFNKPVPIGTPDSPLREHISETEALRLSYKHSVITFFFSAMDFSIPEKNQYAYMMEGFEKAWNEVGPQHSATYTNLPPGKYTFRVKASNNDGLWNEQGVSLKVIVTPPLWQRGWFRALIMVFGLTLLGIGYTLHMGRMRRRNLELKRQVSQRTAQLETAYKELEAFSYAVSHDLRAPLRSLSGFSKALLEDYGDKLDPTGKDYLQRIRKASEHMSHLIDHLLKLSRLTRGEMHVEEVDLGTLVESILEEFRQLHPERKVLCKVAKPVYAKGDKALLRVMLWNLIDNAWKFTAKKEEAIIEFGTLYLKGEKVYFLRDNGIGFDPSRAEKLFEVFFRQHAEFEGTGIGLSTVRRIVLRHGGRIWAEGKPNEGATFYFTLG